MRASIRSALAVTAAAVTVAGASGCSSSSESKDGTAKGPSNGPVVVTDNAERPDKQVRLKDAEYVKVNGEADAAAAKKINEALRSPLDWAVEWASATLLPEQKAECKGRASVVQTKVRLGLRGEIVSASNAVQMIPCYEGEGGLPTIPVIVDLKAGKELTPEDVLDDKTLEKDGLKTLWERLSGPKDDWKDCELEDLQRKDFFRGKRDGDPIESPAPAGLFFTQQGLDLIWSTTGTDCNNFTFTAPYDKIKDLVDPELYPRLLSVAGTK